MLSYQTSARVDHGSGNDQAHKTRSEQKSYESSLLLKKDSKEAQLGIPITKTTSDAKHSKSKLFIKKEDIKMANQLNQTAEQPTGAYKNHFAKRKEANLES